MVSTEHRVERHLAAIFAADVAGYSRLMEQDEVGTLRTLTAHREIIDRMIAEHGGRIANTAGDSVLAEFPSAVDAVQCAVAVQDALAQANQDTSVERRLRFRIGVHVGDVMVRSGDLLGDGVNIAARLESVAEPGGICLSEAAYGAVRKAVPLTFTDLGPQKVKNIDEPIRAFAFSQMDIASSPAQAVSQSKVLPLPDKPSIAVLPFSNLKGNTEQEHFAEGITDDIITELSRISAFLIIARNSTFTFKGTTDVQQVGQDLGVRYIVEGSVRRAGERVRVNVHLLEASTGNHIWGERYDRPLADLFEVQDDITRSIVASTQTQVVLNEGLVAERHERPDFHTWDMAKRGWREIYQLTRESLEKAREIGLAIKQHDPTSPKGPQIVATAAYHLVYMGFASDPAAMRDEALAEAREAMRLDDRDEYTQWTYGNVLMGLLGRREEAIAAYKQALEINPNFSLSYGSLGTTLAWEGRSDESIATVETAIRLNPRDPSIFFRYTALALAYFFKQDYQKARDWAQHAIARRANWWIPWVVLAASLARLNKLTEAKTALSGLLEVLPNRIISTLPFPPLGQAQIDSLREGLRMAGLPD
ncbi:hypothetical protein AA309_19145 [Microvirga vignae]|uniref:Guanylate cyclase domain-containing protein n=1 Tax=Microvirga vignae TaxID=1225564 RepID=A0A0H1R996_9HYPH|nr:adenylate/guanylate cyclase domain-containing protein [Microvirga vignae]KLK91639.1 hypothetical protein AA309_19145 [Microvirga vignae]